MACSTIGICYSRRVSDPRPSLAVPRFVAAEAHPESSVVTPPRGAGDPLARPVFVSIVLPTCNRADLVGRAIRSVLTQTVVDFEVLVVDDGSTDTTAQVIAAISDPRIRSLRLDVNGGVSRARNTAITLARGQWIAFLDDDNEWAPNYLERQLALAASRPGADVVYCRARRRNDRTGQDIGLVPTVIRDGPAFRYLVNRWYPAMSSTMVRRERLSAVGGFDEQLRVAEDWDLWLRLGKQTNFAGTPEVLVVRHENENLTGQLSGKHEFYAGAIAIIERRWGPVIEADCGPQTYRHWRSGLIAHLELNRVRRAVEAGRRREAVYWVVRMCRLLPWALPLLARALAFTLIGPQRYARLAALRTRRAGG